MRRQCSMCKNYDTYRNVRKWKPTDYNICSECQEMISEICRAKWLTQW